VKFGLLDPEAPSRTIGIVTEEIPVLLTVREIVEDASDMMDEEGGIERIILRLDELDGNQSICVSAILEVHPLRLYLLTISWCNRGSNLTTSMQYQYYVLD
jgi:hypothetical protein